ncbi:MAG: glutathione peroxidase [Clostridiales bacterium]|nr:glutathione peroxidase [Clostridiales bacterium]
MKIYDFTVKDMDGNPVSMKEYEGKVLLIVNTATGCGFTPQYEGLEKLYADHRDKGFEILDFPCNQFANQAPGTEKEIKHFCEAQFGTEFKMFAKINVNGENEEPLYTFLKKEKGGFLNSNIKWNFTKFLVDRKGNVVKRFSPAEKPEDIENDIIEQLNAV